MEDFFKAEGIDSRSILHNNHFPYDNYGICGTRGWVNMPGETQDEKVLKREVQRLETSIKSALADELEPIVFLHYPPVYRGYRCQPILDLLHRYGVRQCWYGHLHAESCRLAVTGNFEGIDFRLVSADYVNFAPILVKSSENS